MPPVIAHVSFFVNRAEALELLRDGHCRVNATELQGVPEHCGWVLLGKVLGGPDYFIVRAAVCDIPFTLNFYEVFDFSKFPSIIVLEGWKR